MRKLAQALFCLLVFVAIPAWGLTSNSWTPTGALNAARSTSTATLLPSGKVLVAGGNSIPGLSAPVATAELYDPATGKWLFTGSMNVARVGHTASLLSTGKVLVVGGAADLVAELYDPATGVWTPTGVPKFLHASYATATTLPSGQVLVSGGISVDMSGISVIASAELYDPVSALWTATGSMNSIRSQHTATLLTSGKVLVSGGTTMFGGSPVASAEIYDPAVGTYSSILPMNVARMQHTATLLPSSLVLVANSMNETSTGSAELYNPVTGQWTSTLAMVGPHVGGSAALLASGQVLVAGGFGSGECELFNPATGHWTATEAMNAHRAFAPATLLASGAFLITGGAAEGASPLSTQLYGERIFSDDFQLH